MIHVSCFLEIIHHITVAITFQEQKVIRTMIENETMSKYYDAMMSDELESSSDCGSQFFNCDTSVILL